MLQERNQEVKFPIREEQSLNGLFMDELMTLELSEEGIFKKVDDSIKNFEFTERFSNADKILIKNKLSESEEVRNKILLANSLLVIASTGTGKTFGTIEALRSENKPFIFLVPNTANKDQMLKDYGIQRTVWYGKGDKRNVSIYDLLNEECKEIVCCYETLTNYIENDDTKTLNEMGYYLVIDEVHKIITDLHYRDNLSVINNNIKRKVFLTATPHILNEGVFTNVVKVSSKVKEITKEINVVRLEDGKNWTNWRYKKAIDGIRKKNIRLL